MPTELLATDMLATCVGPPARASMPAAGEAVFPEALFAAAAVPAGDERAHVGHREEPAAGVQAERPSHGNGFPNRPTADASGGARQGAKGGVCSRPDACCVAIDSRSTKGQSAGAGPGAPVFASPREPGKALSESAIARAIDRAARRAGLGAGFSGHSPRIGMALDLSRAGMATHAIQQAGRWASPAMVVRYTRSESAGRGAVAAFYGRSGERACSLFGTHSEGRASVGVLLA